MATCSPGASLVVGSPAREASSGGKLPLRAAQKDIDRTGSSCQLRLARLNGHAKPWLLMPLDQKKIELKNSPRRTMALVNESVIDQARCA
eukprot:3195178-Amphidinium_carterae.2